MDFLNKTYAQIADLFRSMTPGARITAVLLLTAVVVSLGYLFTSQVSGGGCDLFDGEIISPAQRQLILAAFGNSNLNDAVERDSRIFVPQGQKAKYMAAAAQAKALPPTPGSAFKSAIDSGSPFAPETERLARWIAAKQEECRNVICSMRGISSASVTLDSRKTSGFNRDMQFTASVYVQPAGSQELDDEKVSAIRSYVASSVAGLKYANVTVTDPNGHAWTGDENSGGTASDNKYVQLRKEYEKRLSNTIRNSLANIPGATVAVNVVLDPNESIRTLEIMNDKSKSVDVHTIDSEMSRTSDAAGTGGPAGFAANQANRSMTLGGNGAAGGTKEEDTSKKSEVMTVPSGKQTDTVKIGLTPIMEQASINIPSGYFKKAWQLENPPAAGQEAKEPDQAALEQFRTKTIDKIKKQVAVLLTAPDSVTDRTTLVAVTDFPEIPVAPPPEPSMAKTAMTWLGDYWSVAGMIGLAAVSLLMLRSLVKSAPPLEQPAMPRLADTPDTETETISPDKSNPVRVRRFTAGPSVRDEISTLVQEDPDIAANILKTWIGRTG
jgi:flagellar M-ring protein FliF